MSLLTAALSDYEAALQQESSPNQGYIDRRALSRSKLSEAQFRKKQSAMIRQSNALYVGNLSIWTREEQLWQLFSAHLEGLVDIVMGVNRTDKMSAGFCFLVFDTPANASIAHALLSSYSEEQTDRSLSRVNQFLPFCQASLQKGNYTQDDLEIICHVPFIIDDRVVRADFDRGGAIRAEGRYWGRGFSGGQVRDEYRQGIDMARGGANARKFWEAKKTNQFIPKLDTNFRKRQHEGTEGQEDDDEAKDTPFEDYDENVRPVYDWLSFDVNQWKFKVKM